MYRSTFFSTLPPLKIHADDDTDDYPNTSFMKNDHRGSTSSVATLVDKKPGITTPLLHLENKDPYQHTMGCDHFYFYAMMYKTDGVQELKAVYKFVWPLMFTYLLGTGLKLVDVWFYGKLGPTVMAATSLGGLFVTICGFALGNGMLTAIDTLVSQAFTAAQNSWTLGVILQRSIIITGIFCLPISIIWYNAESIMVMMGQDPQLASMAQVYIFWAIPVLFPMLISTAIRKFLQAIGNVRIIMSMVLMLFPVSFLVDYIILYELDLGMQGVGLQNFCFHLTVLFIYIGFLYFGTDFKKKYWPGWTRDAFEQWGTFFKLGVPGMLSVSTDWAFEVCALITGVLGETSLAAQSVVLTVNTFLLMIPYALSAALSVRVGHHLGANKPKTAKLCVILTMIIGFCLVSINAIVMFGFRQAIARHFTKDDLVIEAVISLIGVVGPCHFVIGNGIILSGVLNAFGKQYVVATLNLTSYYMIGLPFGIWLTFSYGWGLLGVWSGVGLAGLIKMVGEAWYLIYYIDWQEECNKATKRVANQELPL